MTDIALRILLQAQDQASRVISGVGGKLIALAGDMGPVVGVALGVGAAVVGVGVAAAMMAGQFQQATNQLITSAGETQANIDMVRNGILQMSIDTATSWQQLVAGMYNVESAGYHGAAGLAVLKAAAEGAKAENADLGVVTDVLTTIMHNYHLPASQAVDVMNSLIQTTSQGKMHLDDLTTAMRNVLPVAQAAHVPLTDVESALAAMSLSGDRGASAGTHLSQMLTYLLSPSTKATKVLKEVGLTTQQISDEMKKSLPGTIQMITDAVGKKFPPGSAAYVAALSAIVGGNKSMKAMLELSGGSLNDFKQKVEAIAPSMKKNSTAVDNWNLIQGNFNFQMEAAKNAVISLLIKIGEGLLPVLTQIVSHVAPAVSWIMNFTSAVSKNQLAMDAIKSVLAGLAIVIGIVLVTAFVNMAIAAWAAMVPLLPFIAIALVIAAVIFGIIQAVRHWGEITAWFGALWHVIFTSVGSFFSGVGGVIHSVVSKIGDAFSGLGSKFHAIWDGIKNVFKGAINFIISGINAFIGFLNDHLHIDVPAINIGPVHIGGGRVGLPPIPLIPLLATGGYITGGGLAMLHPGERVVPAQVARGGAAGETHITIHVHAGLMTDSRQARQLAEIIGRELAAKWRSQANIPIATSGSVRS